MARFMDSLNKGIAAINVKTSNLMESTKLKSAISARESEIASIMKTVGETVYVNRSNFSVDMVADQLEIIKDKYEEIDGFRNQIAALEADEKRFFGDSTSGDVEAKVYCMKCGAPNKIGNRFCEKCGNQMPE